jgi:hypothetical protein
MKSDQTVTEITGVVALLMGCPLSDCDCAPAYQAWEGEGRPEGATPSQQATGRLRKYERSHEAIGKKKRPRIAGLVGGERCILAPRAFVHTLESTPLTPLACLGC